MNWRASNHGSSAIAPYPLYAGPILTALACWRWLSGREAGTDLRQRLALDRTARPGAIWVHGASIGELRAARPLMEGLQKRTGREIVVTTNTLTARKMVAGWDQPGWTCLLAPIDSRAACRRFIGRRRPGMLVNLEGEFWPTRFAVCRARGVPVIGVGTKLSERAAAKRRTADLLRKTLSAFSAIWPMDTYNSDRLIAAGIDPGALKAPFNAKLLHRVAPAADRPNGELIAWEGKPILLAASFHRDEEEVIAGAFADILAKRPDLRLVLTPRHPERTRTRFRQCLQRYGLGTAMRSQGETPDAETPVYLADTLGEMALWLPLAKITIIGGTFVGRGGHTPVEPVMAGSFPVHGPDIQNHMTAFGALDAAGAATRVAGPGELAGAVLAALDDETLQTRVAAGKTALEKLRQEMQDRIDEICRAASAYLDRDSS